MTEIVTDSQKQTISKVEALVAKVKPPLVSRVPQKKIEEANERNLKLQKMALKDELSRVKRELELEKIAKKPMEYSEYLTIKNLKTHKTWYQVAKDHSKRSPSCLAKEFNLFAKNHGYKD